MAKLIGTAGHVDHGKTSLIRAMTGIDADRLPEEKRRGMTIDIGFAYVDLPGIGRASIVDVPGHERFITNMLVGALGIDVALLCVAADESVMPQTREHFQVLRLLPVQKLVVAMTRADLADPDIRSITRTEIEELLAGTRFEGSAIIEVSVVSGEGIDDLKRQLSSILLEQSKPKSGLWYLPIDRVFTIKGHGVVVTGTLMQGEVKDGETAVLLPSGTHVKVRGIQSHEADQIQAEFGQRTALNLGGVKREEVERGMAVGVVGSLFATDCIDLQMEWLDRPKHGARIRLSIGADEAIGRVYLSDTDDALAQVRLERSVAAALGQPAILRHYSPPVLIGGGKVVVPMARARRKSEKSVSVHEGSEEERVLGVIEEAPYGLPTEEVCRTLGRTTQQLGDVFEKLKTESRLRSFAGFWMTPEQVERVLQGMLATLSKLHEGSPTVAGHAKERVSQLAGLRLEGKPLNRFVAEMAAEGRLRMAGSEIAHPEFKVKLSARQEELLTTVEKALEASAINVPAPRELAITCHCPVQAIEEILRIGGEAGRILRLSDELFYTARQMQSIIGEVRGMDSPFEAGAFRDKFGTSRKYAIPVLEYLDSRGVTMRQGDKRVVNK